MAERQVAAWPYRKWILISIAITSGYLILITVFAQQLPRLGTGSIRSSERESAALTIATNFLVPAVALFVIHLSLNDWKIAKADKTYRWQGNLCRAAVVLLCVIVAVYISHSFVWADYEITPPNESQAIRPCDMQLSARTNFLFNIVGFLYTPALGFGILTKGG